MTWKGTRKTLSNLRCDERCRKRLRIWWINCVQKTHGAVYSYIVGEFIWILSMKNWKQITITNQRLNQTIIEVFGLNANKLKEKLLEISFIIRKSRVWSHTKIKKLFTGFKNVSADNFMRILKIIYTMRWCCSINLWVWIWISLSILIFKCFSFKNSSASWKFAYQKSFLLTAVDNFFLFCDFTGTTTSHVNVFST